MPLISVIVPVYNVEKYLNRCVDSILAQTFTDFELILVDDGSPDNCGKICDEFAKKDNRITVLHQENSGQAVARNNALNIAKGSYIAFVDSDDFINRKYLEILLEALIKSESDISICDMTRDMDCFEFNSQSEFDVIEYNKHDFLLSIYDDAWSRTMGPCCKLFKRCLYDELRFPAGKKFEDVMLMHKVYFSAERFVYINVPLYFWFQNIDSTSSQRKDASSLLDREEAIRSHMDYYPPEYEDVNLAARRFYLNQMHSMLWQLDHDFVQNDTTKKVRRFFDKQAKKYYRKYKNLCSIEEQKRIYYYLYPKKSAIKHKLNSIIKH